ncbi:MULTISPECIES: hypothetical protein [unclassified Anabaena]|uniref:hypothetical protein n=1 Tax=unclassified Anabaena TaxID=2619674 RepID=UPI00082F71A7|nr:MULTISPECIES: hypothetical protein [unclassified Anabaena]
MNKNFNKNPFDKKIRGLEYYNKLQIFAEQELDNRFEDLALFIRNVILEQDTPRSLAHELYKYDLIILVPVNKNFPNRLGITINIECCTQIYNHQDSKYIKIQDFLAAPIIKYENQLYTLQNFVFAIAYNGSIHWQPNFEVNQPDLNKLYHDVICEIPETYLRLTHDIARCLVAAYKDIFEKFNGDNNGYSAIMNRQPMIVNNGKLIKDGYDNPTCWFNNSYIQIPIREQANFGIRICLELQLQQINKQGFIFVYGNKQKEKEKSNILGLSCQQTTKFLIFETFGSQRRLLNKIIAKLPISSEMMQKPFKLEVSLYKNGYISLAVNEYLKYCEKIPTNFSIYNGKLIIGANLDGEKFGNFLCSVNSIEAINHQNIIHTIFMSGVRQLSGLDGLQLPPDIIKRPALR